MQRLKLARDLAPGDRLEIGSPARKLEVVTVLGIVESVQTIRRPVLIVTLRGPDGRDVHRTWHPYHTVQTAPIEGGSQ